ncbi:hypothetical protein [Pseudomonas sp. GV085]|uniref:hypothetical protein n=1 Tax=Pseudomonas sp. GV085 TaxID=2135756 RepID=UPI000D3BF15C|nr:hypothetical protein [Pseudomonas sp. GV085]PTR29556.1 hypothetical protein C8K63_101444 [Pseudomonas sp. GV085]
MSRRFNFTGRTKILRENVRAIVEQRDGGLFCNIDLMLTDYHLRPDALVVIEAERGRVLRLRHESGKAGVASSDWKRGSEFDISSMGDPEDIRFRVLVVEPQTCRLLAVAEGIQACNNEDSQVPQRSLLPIRMEDLAGGVWELEMGDTPTLILDSGLGTKQELKSSPILFAILPGVIRAILVNLAHEHGISSDDEVALGEEDDSGMWLSLGVKWAGDPLPNTGTYVDIDDWAQKATIGFCREKKLRNRLANFMSEEE